MCCKRRVGRQGAVGPSRGPASQAVHHGHGVVALALAARSLSTDHWALIHHSRRRADRPQAAARLASMLRCSAAGLVTRLPPACVAQAAGRNAPTRRPIMAQAHGAAAAAAAASAASPDVSQRVRSTDAPCIVATKRLVATTPGTLSLAQGMLVAGCCAPWVPPLLLMAAGPAEGLAPGPAPGGRRPPLQARCARQARASLLTGCTQASCTGSRRRARWRRPRPWPTTRRCLRTALMRGCRRCGRRCARRSRKRTGCRG